MKLVHCHSLCLFNQKGLCGREEPTIGVNGRCVTRRTRGRIKYSIVKCTICGKSVENCRELPLVSDTLVSDNVVGEI